MVQRAEENDGRRAVGKRCRLPGRTVHNKRHPRCVGVDFSLHRFLLRLHAEYDLHSTSSLAVQVSFCKLHHEPFAVYTFKFMDLYYYLHQRSCDESKGVCSFPSAYVQLTKKQQLLMVGQPYKVNLQLEMPESPANKELGNILSVIDTYFTSSLFMYIEIKQIEYFLLNVSGMFMVCAQLRSRDGALVEHACRSAMLHYRSNLLHMLTTFTFSPMMIFGTTEEKQSISLELFGNFEENQVRRINVGP